MKLTEAARIREECARRGFKPCDNTCLLFSISWHSAPVCDHFAAVERAIANTYSPAPLADYAADKEHIVKALRVLFAYSKDMETASLKLFTECLAALERK